MILIPEILFAQGGPPMITDDPGTPGSGHWEINIACTLDNTPDEHLYETPIADINYGWGDRVQLKLEIPWLVVKTSGTAIAAGLGNAYPGVKIRFLDEDSSGINLSTFPQYRISYSNISSSLVGNQFYLPIEASRTFGNLQIDAEAGFNFVKDKPGQWQYGIVAGYNTSKSLQLLAELHATSDISEPTGTIANIGCAYVISDALHFIGSAGRNIAPASAQEYVGYVGVQVLVE